MHRLLLKSLLPGVLLVGFILPTAAQARATLNPAHAQSVAVATTPDTDAAPDVVAADPVADKPAEAPEVEVAAAAAVGAGAAVEVAATPATETATATPDLAMATVVAPRESHLPAWVQIVVSSATLYTSDSGTDAVLAKLPHYTYLRVVDGGTSRLQVQAYDSSGGPGQTGWVSADQVLPSAPGTDWLVASAATTLWPSPEASDGATRQVARFSPLQQLDGPQLNRIHVSVYRSDFSGIVADGWLDVSETGPALPPQARVAAPADVSLAARSLKNGTEQQAAFMSAAADAARQSQALTGVPASVTVAQAILESDWGRSTLAQGANNYFGMKALGTLGNDGVVWMPTSEYDASGKLYQTTSAFRAYKSLADSMADHGRLLATVSRYATAMRSASDPKAFATLIAKAGYSTDPAYADKLVALMDKYNLYSLDA